jgi:hypothetical protein
VGVTIQRDQLANQRLLQAYLRCVTSTDQPDKLDRGFIVQLHDDLTLLWGDFIL